MQRKMTFSTATGAFLLVLCSFGQTAHAADPTAEDIVRQLIPNPGKTRGLGVKTRGINVGRTRAPVFGAPEVEERPAQVIDQSTGQPAQGGATNQDATQATGASSPEQQALNDHRETEPEERPKLSIDLEVFFDFNSAEVTSAAVPVLIQLGTALTDPRLDKMRFIVGGHTDGKGSDVYNMKLSKARADAVRTFLIDSFSISPKRLIAVGFGESELKTPDRPEDDVNRRVEIQNIGPLE